MGLLGRVPTGRANTFSAAHRVLQRHGLKRRLGQGSAVERGERRSLGSSHRRAASTAQQQHGAHRPLHHHHHHHPGERPCTCTLSPHTLRAALRHARRRPWLGTVNATIKSNEYVRRPPSAGVFQKVKCWRARAGTHINNHTCTHVPSSRIPTRTFKIKMTRTKCPPHTTLTTPRRTGNRHLGGPGSPLGPACPARSW